MGVFYLILMAALGLGLLRLRHGGPGDAGGRDGPRGWAVLTRHALATAIGGYLLLMAVVIGYYYGIARVGGAFLSSAVSGTALLIALATPVFAAASWLSGRARRARKRPPRQAPPPRR